MIHQKIPGALGIILLLLFNNISAQVNHGGRPVMNAEDFDPSDVIYIVEPADPIMVEALKSQQEYSYKKVLEYAIELSVDLSPEYNGGWHYGDKMDIWRVHLISPDAYSLGVLFSEYVLNEGVRLFLYDKEGEHIKGAFTKENNKTYERLFVAHIPGDEVVVEMQVDHSVSDYGRLRIGSVSHAVIPLFNKKAGIGDSQACEIDINCVEGEEWQLIKRAVCQITTPSVYCTGTLINNTDYNGIPYILTAEHCINSEFRAENSVFIFGYENTECFGQDAWPENSKSGSSLIATGDSIDFTLVKLLEPIPREYNVYYAGWDLRETNFSSSVTIHHPNADAKKISYDFDPMATPESVPGDLNDYIIESNYWIKRWDIGSTEGGSSGGPLFNSNKRLIGILSGGLAYCGDSIGYDEVNERIIFSKAVNVNDYYSRLYYGWDYYDDSEKQLKKWLDPRNTGQISIGGLNQMTLDAENSLSAVRGLHIYPNPNRGVFYVELPGKEYMEAAIQLFRQDGILLESWKKTGEFVEIDASDLPPGIYFLRLSNASQSGCARIVITE